MSALTLIDLRFVLLQCCVGEAKCKMQQENYQLPDDLCAALAEDSFINIWSNINWYIGHRNFNLSSPCHGKGVYYLTYPAALAFIWTCISGHMMNVSPIFALLFSSVLVTTDSWGKHGSSVCRLVLEQILYSWLIRTHLPAAAGHEVVESDEKLCLNQKVVGQNNEPKDAKTLLVGHCKVRWWFSLLFQINCKNLIKNQFQILLISNNKFHSVTICGLMNLSIRFTPGVCPYTLF